MVDFAAEFEAFNTMMEAETTQAVKMWMNWMALVFIASLIFVWKYKPARFVLLGLLMTVVGGVICWLTLKNVHLLGIVHFVVWLPLAIYLWRKVLSRSAKTNLGETPSTMDRAFFFWVALVFLTILISLVFDARDIYLVLMDQK